MFYSISVRKMNEETSIVIIIINDHNCYLKLYAASSIN